MKPEDFGKYTLVELLGTGGMARVYRAVLRGAMGFEKEVALKQIKRHVKLDDRYLQALINEARLGGQLRHRNIVEVYEFDRVGDEYYLAMEYVQGWTLLDLVNGCRQAQQPMPPPIALQICIEICRGLDHAHDMTSRSGLTMNLVHRDLKPANVIVSTRGEVKIMDFGIAKADTNLYKTTAAQITKGTPLYMSPEQVDASSTLTRQSDVFSLGSILYELVFMQPLFAGDHALEVLHRVLMVEIEQPLALARVRLPGLDGVLQRALARRPENRYRTAGEMAEDLDELLGQQGPGPTVVSWLAQYEREQTTLAGQAGGTVGEDDPTELFSEPGIGEEDPTQQFQADVSLPDDITRRFFETSESEVRGAPGPVPGPPPAPPHDPPPATPPPPPPPSPRRSGRWMVPVVVLLMILAVGVALFGTVGAALLGWWARDQQQVAQPPTDPPTPALATADDDDSAGAADGQADAGDTEVAVIEPPTPEPATPEPATPEPATPEPATPAPPPPPEPTTPAPPPPDPIKAPPPPPPVYDSDEPATITVNSVPWAETYLDGRIFQRTPIMSRQIPAGRHELRLVCGVCGVAQESTVVFDVAPGEVWKKTDIRFQK